MHDNQDFHSHFGMSIRHWEPDFRLDSFTDFFFSAYVLQGEAEGDYFQLSYSMFLSYRFIAPTGHNCQKLILSK